jgi:protein TonB
LFGGISRRDYRYLRQYAVPGGRATLAILIGPDGRVLECSTRQSSGDRALDSALCHMLQQRMRWAPARDRSGRPLTVGIIYTAVWSRD